MIDTRQLRRLVAVAVFRVGGRGFPGIVAIFPQVLGPCPDPIEVCGAPWGPLWVSFVESQKWQRFQSRSVEMIGE
jgi:hypothetical protein